MEKNTESKDLVEREQLLKCIFQQTSDGILVLDQDLRIVLVNNAVLMLTGYTEKEALGNYCFKVTHGLEMPCQLPHGVCPVVECKKTGKPVKTEHVHLNNDGSKFFVEVSVAPITDHNGKIYYLHVTKDITKDKLAKQLQAVIEASPDFIGFADAKDLNIIYINKAGRKMCGIGENGNVTKLKIFDTHPRYVNQKFVNEIFSMVVRDGTWKGESAFLNIIDGREIPVSMVLSAHKAPSGEVEIFSTISRDITERKLMEVALQESEQKFRTIFNSASDGMFLLDLETKKFFMCNAACLKILGFTPEEFIDLGIADLHPPEDLPFIFEQIEKFLNGEIGNRSDVRFRRKDGTILFTDLSPSLMTLAGKNFALVIFKDITERKRAEEEKEKLIIELKEALAKVKMLSGILPVCASCKKIRDDKGHWQQVEVYIRDRSEADFSHGICPECIKKLYPDYILNE